MDAAHTIRVAVARVAALRFASAARPELAAAVTAIKQFQSRRFAHTYADMLAAGPYQGASQFFLGELYSDKDYSQRDAQFSRIANALQTMFPKHVVATAVALAQLHSLTEGLDHAMGLAWLAVGDAGLSSPAGVLTVACDVSLGYRPNEVERYVAAWRAVGRHGDRDAQLSSVLLVGQELDRLTRAPGLRLLLKMMRRPAHAAGLSALQSFLEAGFDTFAEMGGRGEGAKAFLALIQAREKVLIEDLFTADLVTLETKLGKL
jgi:hypothetical protein